MEEEVADKEIGSESPPSGKKYVTTWRNKWLTSSAGNIDYVIQLESIKSLFLLIWNGV